MYQDPDKILVLDAQGISNNSNNNLLTENIIMEGTNLVQSIQEDTNMNHDNILNKIRSFKKFQVKVESKTVFTGGCTYCRKKRPEKLQMIYQDL